MEKMKVETARDFLANINGSNSMRPFIAKDGKPYEMTYKGGDRLNVNSYEQKLVTNATLRYDEWRTLDDVVIKIAEDRLVGFEDLRRNGLVKPLGNAMGTTVLTWEEMSDAMEAITSIDPMTRGKNDTVDFNTAHIPIPVTYADYTISERLLQESRNRGTGLETINAERAARKVAEKLENMLFSATSTLTYGGGTINSYISHPDKNSVTLGTDWDASGKTGVDIKDDVLAMTQASINDNYYGPWMLYVPTAYQTILNDDYDVSGASIQTIRQRLEGFEGIQKVQVVDKLPANTVILVTMRSDVVDIIDGMGFQNVQWDSEGGFVHNFKVMTIQVPRVKSDYDNKSGIVVLS